ncbi:MAG TPA: GAF domain-containing protein [Kofleriaceae bacterium]
MSVQDRVLAFARELQRTTTFSEVLSTVLAACTRMGYPNAWLFVAPPDAPGTWKLVEVAGSHSNDAWLTSPAMKVSGDAMLEAIEAANAPVVTLDARTDPKTDKRYVTAMRLCTMINVPLRYQGEPFGAFGTGTFTEHGVRPPTSEDIEEVALMAAQLEPAVARIRCLAQDKGESEEELRRRLFAIIPRWFASLDPNLQNLLDSIVWTLGREFCAGAVLQLVETARQQLQMAAIFEPDRTRRDALKKHLADVVIRPGVGLPGMVLASRAALRIERVEREPLGTRVQPGKEELVATLSGTSLLSVPLISRGNVIGVLTMFRSPNTAAFTLADEQLGQDFADRAALAVENAQMYAQLEQRVAARTRELQEANRDLESFSYSVAHDLRAPLRALGHFAVALAEDQADRLDDKGRDYIQRIQRAGEQMTQITEALLSLARMTRKEIMRERVDLGELATTIVDPLRTGEPERHVDLVVPRGLVVEGDTSLLRALFENLLGNAWKFTRGKDPARIELGSELVGADRIYFVRDNGAGFDPRFTDKLFAPFQRLHSAHEFEGSGIGLATAAKIVQRHGGRIWAEGRVGEGATMRFTLPRP